MADAHPTLPSQESEPSHDVGKGGPDGEQCRYCHFYEFDVFLDKPGKCHRYPMIAYPAPQQGRMGIISVVSMPGPNYWCGEFRKRGNHDSKRTM